MLHFPNYRQDVDQLINAAITAVNPTLAVQRFLRRTQNTLYVDNTPYDLAQGRCFLISVGKAARPMAQAAINLLGDDLSAAIIISKRSQSPIPNFPISQSPISFFQAAHPVSDEVSVQVATAVSTLLATCQPNDLVLCLISGGTSALLAQPLLPLADWQALTAALL
ncbi:MAG: DUF4147 domain-containing protein, partial [Methylococcales bacterium]|nr:DUF4147 domain-containing protein [Methylococcales bacterium]